ncbi:hypothetical protein, partial [Coprococcus eutactus]|uniref:hypothetical protein n=1 Tax=Coprococcus eutactus TaxID=33043 RepID=UPI00210909D1
LASGLLLAEALLLAMQGLALFLLLRGLQPDRAGDRFWGGLTIGLLMLRPAFQYAGLALALALVGAGLLS